MGKSKVGLIGLAVMGANLARNISDKGFKTSVYNRSTEKTKQLIADHGSDTLKGEETLEAFVSSLEIPRKIIILVKAGNAVDAVIEQLIPFIDKGDMIIDGGNSNFRDTQRRTQKLKSLGLEFIGCGVSGGEEGALKGPSLMPGGSKENWEKVKEILQAIAAKDFDGNPCVTHVGADGAGHYVKMVHNGVEYAVMQMIAESYHLLKKLYGLTPPEIAQVFDTYNKGRLESFLFEISVPTLRKKDDQSDNYLIDVILDKAGQKGTGKWTAIDALDRGVAVSSISEAVFARVNSSYKDLRVQLSKHFPAKDSPSPLISLDEFVQVLENTLYGAILSAYAQGLEMIKLAASEESWDINVAEIARIWQGGCIIRAKILQFITDAFGADASNNPHLFLLPPVQKALIDADKDWRKCVSMAINSSIPVPALSSALGYLDAITQEESSANIIQILRDFFGAHTYMRKDKEGVFHTNWLD